MSAAETVTRREFLLKTTVAASAFAGLSLLVRAGPARDPVQFDVGVAGAGMAGLGFRVIKELRLDEKYEFNLNVLNMGVTEAEQGLVQRRFPVGIFSPISAVRANAQGFLVRVFAPFFLNHNSIVVRMDSPYRSLEDLKGKPVGTLPKISGTFNSFAALCILLGIGDPEKFFQLRFGEVPALIAFLERGDVEAVTVFEAFTSRLLGTGRFRELLGMNAEFERVTGAGNLLIGMGAYSDWLRHHREDTRRFRRMMAAAAEHIRANGETVIRRHGRDVFGLETEEQFRLAARRLPRFYTALWDERFFGSQAKQTRPMVDVGLLPKGAVIRDVFWE